MANQMSKERIGLGQQRKKDTEENEGLFTIYKILCQVL